jgi:hypothetical protein
MRRRRLASLSLYKSRKAPVAAAVVRIHRASSHLRSQPTPNIARCVRTLPCLVRVIPTGACRSRAPLAKQEANSQPSRPIQRTAIDLRCVAATSLKMMGTCPMLSRESALRSQLPDQGSPRREKMLQEPRKSPFVLAPCDRYNAGRFTHQRYQGQVRHDYRGSSFVKHKR